MNIRDVIETWLSYKRAGAIRLLGENAAAE
jgi:hypothetical protein